MLETSCLKYSDIFSSLQKIILERDFGEIINFESMLKEKDFFDLLNQEVCDEELEIIGLCALYIFCIMLKKDEENIFPFLREYILTILVKSCANMEEYNVKNKLENFYSLENNTIEQRYLYILAAFGYNNFNSNVGLENTNEFDTKIVDKLLLKIFITYYTQFNTETIQGLFLLYRYGEEFKNNLSPFSLTIFEIILRRIVVLLANFDNQKDYFDEEDEIANQIEKINLV